MSSHESDRNPSEEDSTEEADSEGQTTHKESIKAQKKRKVQQFTTVPFVPSNFPPRTQMQWRGGRSGRGKGRLGWRGGRRRGPGGSPIITEAGPVKTKMSLRKRTEKKREQLFKKGHDEEDDDGQEDHGPDHEFLPHPRDRVVEAALRRGTKRPYQSLEVVGKEKRHRKTDKFTNYDRNQQLDYATRVFR